MPTPTIRTVRAHDLILDLGSTPTRTRTGSTHPLALGLGPGFLPRPAFRMSLDVPVLGVFLLGALPLPSAMVTLRLIVTNSKTPNLLLTRPGLSSGNQGLGLIAEPRQDGGVNPDETEPSP
jgi:hypothetical protein